MDLTRRTPHPLPNSRKPDCWFARRYNILTGVSQSTILISATKRQRDTDGPDRFFSIVYLNHITRGKDTHVSVNPPVVRKTRSRRCAMLSPINCGSSMISTLYFEIRWESIATPSVSANLRPMHARVPWDQCASQQSREQIRFVFVPIANGANASFGQSPRKRSGLNSCGESQ